jgi:hypothetical protein
VEKLEVMKLGKAAETVRQGVQETFSYYAFPSEHWRRFGRITLLSGSCVRSGEERVSWAISRMGTPP